MAWRSMAIRSRPKPNAKPVYFSESMPQFLNTFGSTEPQPAATATLATAEHAAHVHFGRRLREREEARAETGLDAFAEQLVHEHLQHSLQVCKADVFVNHQTFALLEHRGVGRIVVDAEHVARSNHAERRLVRFHVVDLRAGGVRTQHYLVVHVERVLHVAAWVVRRRIESLEVVPVRFDVATEVHFETHLAKEVDNLFTHVVKRMRAARRNACTRERGIYKAATAPFLPRYFTRRLLTASWFVRSVCASSASNACFTLLIASLIVATNVEIFSQRGRSPPRFSLALCHPVETADCHPGGTS